MFPIRDTVRSRSFPIVNWMLIGINVLVFLLENWIGRVGGPYAYQRFMTVYGLLPARLSWQQPLTFLTLISSMFIHGGWIHLISNMWTLFIFGDNIEDRMGKLRYLVFYLLSGVASGAAQMLLMRHSDVPIVGASGAIAGVLGAYFVLFPRSRVLTFIPLFILPWFIEVPAFVFLGLWFVTQLFSGVLTVGARGSFGGIAWWAHIGGFLFGALLVRFFARRPRVEVLPSWDDVLRQ